MPRSAVALLLVIPARLSAQEFEFGMAAPPAILENFTFEVRFTLSSRGIPPGQKGAQGWTLVVAHQGLDLLSMTTEGTVVDDLFDNGFIYNQVTRSTPERPQNDGFISGVVLATQNLDAALPPEGTVNVARANYRTGASSCSGGARIAVADGLQGRGVPLRNNVAWDGRSLAPLKSEVAYADCATNLYHFRIEGPASPLSLKLGERADLDARVLLGQETATANGWSLAVGHDPDRLQLLSVTIEGTGVEPLLAPGGFALFELTSGPGNAGFTARVELSPEEPRALPAPEHPVAAARYQLAPFLDPALGGTRVETAIRFAGSLEGSGGPVANQVLPPGRLTAETFTLEIDIQPAERFLRGDGNADGRVDISDPVGLLFHLFGGLQEAIGCLEAANANDDGQLDVTDVIFTLERLFLLPQPFPLPSPDCGVDPEFLSLGCARTACR